jgi:hyperosmotically inducible periplasmic protein
MELDYKALAAGVAAAVIVSFAHAQPHDKFHSLDRNADGFVSKDEVAHIEGYANALEEADENRDGKLSPDEFTKAEAIHDRALLGKYVDDGLLTAKVKTALLREKGLKSTDVSVESYRGRVLLSGFVQDDQQRKKALLVASKVEGVREVKDGMTVR